MCELLKEKKIKEVTPEHFLTKNFSEPVFTVLESKDYFKSSDNSSFDKNDFYSNPDKFESNFERFAQVADIYISGHFQSKDAPVIVSQEMLRSVTNSIKIVADISCDFDGSIACSIQKSSIEKPFYGYLPSNNEIVDVFHPGAIAVMSISNLPCELAKDASDGFGEMLLNTILPPLLEQREDEILTNARVTINGKLTKKYSYLTNYIAGVEG